MSVSRVPCKRADGRGGHAGRDGGGTFGRPRSRVDSLHGSRLVAPRLGRGWLCRARALATYTRKRDTVSSGVGGLRRGTTVVFLGLRNHPPCRPYCTIWDQSAHGRWDGGGCATPSIIFDGPLPCRCSPIVPCGVARPSRRHSEDDRIVHRVCLCCCSRPGQPQTCRPRHRDGVWLL